MTNMDLIEQIAQIIIVLDPRIADLHTASQGNIITLAPVISDLLRQLVPPQVVRRIL